MNRVRTFVISAALVAVSLTIPPAEAAASGTGGDRFRTSVIARVRAGSPSTAALRAMSKVGRTRALGRCIPIAALHYCLGFGWGADPDYAAVAREPVPTRPTGDMTMSSWVRQRAALSDSARKAVEVEEIENALAGLRKARRIQAVVDGDTRAVGRVSAYAQAAAIMNGFQTRQTRSYFCGPATLQSIDWADDGTKNDQDALAENQLGTDSSGTRISSMVAAINRITGWDRKAGGPYQVQSVVGWSADAFYNVHRAQLGDETPAPIVEHPKLSTAYFWYLNFSHSGHYQVGRGFQTVNAMKQIHIFEVFNEADFNSAGATTWGPRTIAASALLQATKANSAHQNIGL